MKNYIFGILKSGKFASKRVVIFSAVAVLVFLLSFVAIAGFAIWKVASHSVTQVQTIVPKDLPQTIGSTLEKVKDSQTLQGCFSMLSGMLTLEPWLSQPLNVNIGKIAESCWPAQTRQQKEGEVL